jgi:protein TonB
VRNRQPFSVLGEVRHGLSVIMGAMALTLVFFIVLPLMQTISKPPAEDLYLQTVDVGNIEPPPPPPPEEEMQQDPEPEEAPPELVEEAPPLDLSQLELALNPGLSGGWAEGGDFAVKLNTVVSASKGDDLNAVFSMADLDQKPRVIYQPGPTLTRELRRKAPGKVNIIFIVDERGRVVDPRIRSSTDPAFEKPAMSAVKRWKFEPGKRGGKAVRFRMLAPITFPEG